MMVKISMDKKNYITIKNEKRILNVGNHILRTWPEDCFLISIIQNKPNSYAWIMNSFIQICTYKSPKDENSFRINFYPSGKHHYSVNLYDYCPFIDKYVINNGIIMQLFKEYTDFLIFAINNGYYVSCSLDQFFKNENEAFGLYHPNYIYGYDSIENKIYLSDNFDRGRYTFLNISFQDINKSFEYVNKYSKNLYNHKTYLYKLRDSEYKFDSLKLTNLLEDYLNSCDSTDYKSQYHNNKFYGIKCYKLFYPYLMRLMAKPDQNIDIDLKSFVFLTDHKKMMVLRIKYMLENNYLSCNSKTLAEEYSILNELCERILALAIKYNITKNFEILDKIINYLKIVEIKDYYLTEKLIQEIKNSFTVST